MKQVKPNHRLCVAPMMTHTDRHFRYLLRLISKHVMLYTEMITTGALTHGKQVHRLEFQDCEHPLGLQLGGNDPVQFAFCARLAEDMSYDEININVGCPSDRVQNGQIGACLMAHPELVAECVQSIKDTVHIPVTVKTRIGIDQLDQYEHLHHFINIVADGGCQVFILHARKAWLSGLSPRQNREVPPLDYNRVYRLKQDFPELNIVINGGIVSLEQVKDHLQHIDGVMIGRAVCNNPYLLSDADKLFFDDNSIVLSREEILRAFIDYTEYQLAAGVSLHQMMRHTLGLFQGLYGARAYRRYLSERMHVKDRDCSIVKEAMNFIKAA